MRSGRLNKVSCLLFFVLFFCALNEEVTPQNLIKPGANDICLSLSLERLTQPAFTSFPLMVLSDDFDGDHVPDLVYSSGNSGQSELYIQLSTHSHTDWLGNGGGKLWLQLEGLDVNNDHFLDLVLTGISPTIPAAVFLGDGRGNFKQADSWNYFGAQRRPGHYLSSPANTIIETAALFSVGQEHFDHLSIKYQPPICKANLLAPGNGWIRCLYGPSPQYSPRSPPFLHQGTTL
jgi:hypothetical protein